MKLALSADKRLRSSSIDMPDNLGGRAAESSRNAPPGLSGSRGFALAGVGDTPPFRFLGTVLWRKARPTSTATRRANAKNSPEWRAIHSFNNKSWRSRKSGGPWRRSKRSSSAKPAGRDGCYPYVGDSQKGPEELKDAAGP